LLGHLEDFSATLRSSLFYLRVAKYIKTWNSNVVGEMGGEAVEKDIPSTGI
jgi:hypothetical protein